MKDCSCQLRARPRRSPWWQPTPFRPPAGPLGECSGRQKSDGTLFRIPLENPQELTLVTLSPALPGADGLLLLDPGTLVVVANQVPDQKTNAAVLLQTQDGWQSATTRTHKPLGEVYPTTAALKQDQILVLHSNLDQLITAAPGAADQLNNRATLLPVSLREN